MILRILCHYLELREDDTISCHFFVIIKIIFVKDKFKDTSCTNNHKYNPIQLTDHHKWQRPPYPNDVHHHAWNCIICSSYISIFPHSLCSHSFSYDCGNWKQMENANPKSIKSQEFSERTSKFNMKMFLEGRYNWFLNDHHMFVKNEQDFEEAIFVCLGVSDVI